MWSNRRNTKSCQNSPMRCLAVLWLKKVVAPSLQALDNLFLCACRWMSFPGGVLPGLGGKHAWQIVLLGLMLRGRVVKFNWSAHTDTQHQVAASRLRADEQGGKRTERLQGEKFVRRFLVHILPQGLKRIRHYGVLASACKTDKLNQARLALQMPPPNREAAESAQAFMARVAKLEVMRCPCCKTGTLRWVQTLAGQRQLPAPGTTMSGQARGPP